MTEGARRRSQFASWSVGLLVVVVLTMVYGIMVRLPILLVLAAVGTPTRILDVLFWLLSAGALAGAIATWRALRRRVLAEEQRQE